MKFEIEDKYKKTGITAFLVISASILLFFAIYRYEGLLTGLASLTFILRPVIYGLVMAYLLCPLFNALRRLACRIPWPTFGSRSIGPVASSVLATTLTLCTFLALVLGLLWVAVPRLIESIITVSATLPESMNQLILWLGEKFRDMPQVTGPSEVWIQEATDRFTQWVEETLIPRYNALLSGLSAGVVSFLNIFKDFVIGFIFAGFYLNHKDTVSAQVKKLSFAILKPQTAESFLQGSAFVNRTFGGFINGNIILAGVVGSITFLFMTAVGWPYAALISLLVGVTNLIPFFGPFIGGIPSALLVLMAEPDAFIYFVLFLLTLQTVEGYWLAPKVLGNTTGLPTLWVLVAILVGGGLMGFLGMILGVPVCAVLYAYLCYYVDRRLRKKGLSVDLEDYHVLYKPKNPKDYDEDCI